MTDMYDEPEKFQGKLNPYKHEEMLEVRWRVRTPKKTTDDSSYLSPKSQRGRAKDPVAYLQSVEQRARERQVSYETVKLLRQRVIDCYRREGVNFHETCRKEASEYYKVVDDKDMGQVQPKWSKPEMMDGW